MILDVNLVLLAVFGPRHSTRVSLFTGLDYWTHPNCPLRLGQRLNALVQNVTLLMLVP